MKENARGNKKGSALLCVERLIFEYKRQKMQRITFIL